MFHFRSADAALLEVLISFRTISNNPDIRVLADVVTLYNDELSWKLNPLKIGPLPAVLFPKFPNTGLHNFFLPVDIFAQFKVQSLSITNRSKAIQFESQIIKLILKFYCLNFCRQVKCSASIPCWSHCTKLAKYYFICLVGMVFM